MRYPEFLHEGGRIGFIAPSFGCSEGIYKDGFVAALKYFEGEGYKSVLGPNSMAGEGIGKSNTPEKCGAEVNDFFINDRADAIISCGGGETMCEDLEYIDFPAIAKAKPLWYMGYSDNTNLTFTLPTLCDTAAIYAPCASSWGMKPRHRALDDAFGIMCGKVMQVGNYDGWEFESLKDEDNPYAPYNITREYRHFCFDKGELLEGDAVDVSFEGRLIGGCLDCLINLIGTPFDAMEAFAEKYRDDGIIWFIEACDLNVMDIRRALWQMNAAGWFKYTKGFLIGRPRLFDDSFGDYGHINAFCDMLAKFNVPVLLDVDLGHLPPMMPVISGACAKVTAKGNTLNIKHILK